MFLGLKTLLRIEARITAMTEKRTNFNLKPRLKAEKVIY